MLYVAFIKIFLSRIRANWWALESFPPPVPKNVLFPLSRHDRRRVYKKFFSHCFARTDGCLSHFGLLNPKTFDSHFLDMMYVEFIKKIFLADSIELMGVSHFGLLSQKTFDCYFLDMMYVAFMKNFFSPIRANWLTLESFRPPEPKNVWSSLSRHDVRRVHENFFSRRFERTDMC